MDLSSFLTSLSTSFLIFFILMLLFTWLSRRPGNAVIYYPNRVLKGMDPWEGGSGTRNPFAWIKESFSSTEQDLIKASGVDTAVYFVFLSTVFGILVLSGIVLLPVLLPVSATDDGLRFTSTTSNGTFNNLDKLSIGNIRVSSPRLWAFMLSIYWVSFVTYYLLWKAYVHVSDLRAKAFMLVSDVQPEQFAILVRDIPALPEGQTRKEQVDSYFKSIYPDTFYKSMVITDNKEVNKIHKELEGYKKKLERAEAVYAISKSTGKPEGARPTNKTGLLGLIGKKVDSIDYYNEKINELLPKLVEERKVTLREKQLASALVFFTNRLTAASAAQSLHAQMVDHWTVIDAPESRQIIWPNLKIKFFQRQIRQYFIYVFVALTVLFYMIPIALISAFTTLKNLMKIIPFIEPVVKIDALRTVLEAYLPQLALILFLALLPTLLLFLSKAEGIASQSHAIRATSGKYFYFIVFNVFLGVTVSGTLYNSLKRIQDKPSTAIDMLAHGLPPQATFFLTFIALRLFVGYGLELSRIIPFIVYHLKRKYLCKTEGERKAAWSPGDMKYAIRVPNDLLVITLSLCYSVIAPLILPVGALYFGLGWLVLRNQALKVYVPSYESHGRMWPHMYKRIVAALVLYQVTMCGFIGGKKFYYAPLLLPLPLISVIFAFTCNKKFYRAFTSTALEVASQELKQNPDMETIYKSFIPASLSSENVEDDKPQDVLAPVPGMVTNV